MRAINASDALQAARDLEVLRGSQLLVAAQRYFSGEMTEDDFHGFVCRYGSACAERAELMHQIDDTTNSNVN